MAKYGGHLEHHVCFLVEKCFQLLKQNFKPIYSFINFFHHPIDFYYVFA